MTAGCPLQNSDAIATSRARVSVSGGFWGIARRRPQRASGLPAPGGSLNSAPSTGTFFQDSLFARLMVASFLAGLIATSSPVRPASSALSETVADSEVERNVLSDAVDGRLDHHSFWTAAIVFSGVVHPGQVDQYCRRMDKLTEELRGELEWDAATAQRAERAFQFMHLRLCTGPYDVDGSEIPRMLDEGRFNCVSATITYLELCSRLNIPVQGVISPGHVFVRWNDAPRTVVQTTDPEWFRHLGGLESREVLRPLPDMALGTAQDRTLSQVELLAKLYYNRGSRELRNGRYASACHLLSWAWRLDPADAQARTNLVTSCNRGALVELQSGRFEQSAAWIRSGLHVSPNDPTLLQNGAIVHATWAQHLRQQQQDQLADKSLASGPLPRPDEPFVRQPGNRDSSAGTAPPSRKDATARSRSSDPGTILRPPHLTAPGS